MINTYDIYNTYNNKEFIYEYPYSFEKLNKEYLRSEYYPKVVSFYGDSFSIQFYIGKKWDKDVNLDLFVWDMINPFTQENYEDFEVLPDNLVYMDKIDENILEGNNIKITFYNFRYEEIYTETIPANSDFTIYIEPETAKEIFKRGIYYCSLLMISEDELKVRTILPAYKYCILIN